MLLKRSVIISLSLFVLACVSDERQSKEGEETCAEGRESQEPATIAQEVSEVGRGCFYLLTFKDLNLRAAAAYLLIQDVTVSKASVCAALGCIYSCVISCFGSAALFSVCHRL